jgi:ParB-like chromosome segregation protein Spo0J
MNITFPCLATRLVPRELVVANNYNPNSVSAEKMELLRQSILDNGFCFPIVTIWDDERELYVIIDGFHRRILCGPEWLNIAEIPIVVLEHDIARRMTATVQFNKARGVHQIDLDADVIRALLGQGMTEDEISVHLGIDLETIHRYKQLTGIAELFKKSDYSTSWEMTEV